MPHHWSRRDQGAVAVLVSMLLAGGVLLGFAALAVDVGRLYLEREHLQSGADAAALAVAKACAYHTSECAAGRVALLAEQYTDANAPDGETRVAHICGDFLESGPTPCDAPAQNLTACLGAPPQSAAKWVEVRVATEMADGSTVLPPSFAGGMVGNGGYQGATVGACARYQWQTRAPTVLALALSDCEFDQLTANKSDFAQEPPYSSGEPDSDYERTIYVDHHSGSHPCDWDYANAQPGSYYDDGDPAWLHGGSDCLLTAVAGAGNWVDGDGPGAGHGGSACSARLQEAWQSPHDPIYLALYDRVQYLGGGGWRYHIVGYVPLVVAAYDLNIWHHTFYGGRVSWRTGQPACDFHWQESCVSGYFVGPSVTVVDDPTTVRLIG